jgi:hypothetical protein
MDDRSTEIRELGHLVDVDLLHWFVPDRRPRPWPGDGSVRRVLPIDARVARAALELFLRDAQPDRARPVMVTARGTELTLPGPRPGPAEVRLRHRLHPVRVVLVVDAWSALRAELRLDPVDARRRRRSLDRWFEGAHDLLDRLRFEIDLRAGAVSR